MKLLKKKLDINNKTTTIEEEYYIASHWQLMWRKLRKHRLAITGGIVLAVLYTGAIFCEFFSPYDIYERHTDYLYCSPQKIHFFDEKGKFNIRPFVYALKKMEDPETWAITYAEDRSTKYPIYFFIHGAEYKLWGLFPSDIHLFGVEEPGTIFLFGTEKLGRDIFSRIIHASRISLSIGLIGVAISFVLGCILGGISGYFGGTADTIIQRIIEFLISIPTLPLWMTLGAALPVQWSPIKVYLGITVILSVSGWCGLAPIQFT